MNSKIIVDKITYETESGNTLTDKHLIWLSRNIFPRSINQSCKSISRNDKGDWHVIEMHLMCSNLFTIKLCVYAKQILFRFAYLFLK